MSTNTSENSNSSLLAGGESTSPPPETSIEVRDLYKVFGAHPNRAFPLLKENKSKEEILAQTGCTIGINKASFSVFKKEVFVIMGLSGSGKSTVIRCLNRLIEPTRGEVLIAGQNIMEMSRTEIRALRRKRMSMVFQHFGLLPHRNVQRNVEFGLEIVGGSAPDRAEKARQAIDLVGLGGYEDSRTDELSGGMQQRVGLARAIASDPEVLLMDEAFSALDPLIRNNMQDELIEMQARLHKTIVFITHDLDEALKLGDRIAIMKDGIIEQIGTPETILTHPASDYIRSFVENVDRSKVITAKTIMRKPDIVATHKDGPHQALRHMRDSGHSTLYVVDHERRFRGIVRIDDTAALVKQGGTDLTPILVSDVPQASLETSLIELMPDASGYAVPIAVLDDEKRLKGIVTRASILAAICGEGETT